MSVVAVRTTPWIDKVAALAARFADSGLQRECPLVHRFEPGWYVREITIPHGTLFIGREHLLGHRCELVSGSLLWCLEGERRYVSAPFEVTTRPGDRMVLYADTDVVGRTWHPNPSDDRDLDALEARAFAPRGTLIARGRALLELPLGLLP